MSVPDELTPTQRQCIERSKAFHAAIAARAVPQKSATERSFAVNGYTPPPPKPVLEEPPRAEPCPPPGSVFFQIVDDTAGYPTVRKIQLAVCSHYGIGIRDMLSARRTFNLIVPRHVAMYLCKELTPRSLPDIGRRFGHRDHTTVLHAVRKIGNWINCGKYDVAADVALLRAQLEVQEA